MSTKKEISLPTFIDIGPYHYVVTTDELTRQRAQENSHTSLLGQTNLDTLVMVLNRDQPVSLMRETFLHEILHTITAITGISFEFGPDKDEALIRRLSPTLLAFLRSNPDVVSYLMDD